MRFIRLIVRRVVRGLGHLDFSILSLNGDSKVPIFLSLSAEDRGGSPEEKKETKKLGHRQLNAHEQKKQPQTRKDGREKHRYESVHHQRRRRRQQEQQKQRKKRRRWRRKEEKKRDRRANIFSRVNFLAVIDPTKLNEQLRQIQEKIPKHLWTKRPGNSSCPILKRL